MTEPDTSEQPGQHVRVELRLRERTPACVTEPLEDFRDRVGRLERSGVVDDCRIETWACETWTGERPNGESAGSATAATVADFRAWARRNGYTLRPAFDRRERTTLISERSRTELVVPLACLAVYEGEELACVAPCSTAGDGDRADTCTVGDCLDALEAGVTEPLADRDRDRSERREYEDGNDTEPEPGTEPRVRTGGDAQLERSSRVEREDRDRRSHAHDERARRRSFSPELR